PSANTLRMMANGMMTLMLTTSSNNRQHHRSNSSTNSRATAESDHSGCCACTCLIGTLVVIAGASGCIIRAAAEKMIVGQIGRRQGSAPTIEVAFMMIIMLFIMLLGLSMFVTAVIASSKYVERWQILRTTILRLSCSADQKSSAPFQSACFAIAMVLIPPIIAMCWRAGNADTRAKEADERAMKAETQAKEADLRALEADTRAKEADSRAKEATALARRVVATRGSNEPGSSNYPRRANNSEMPNIENIPTQCNPRADRETIIDMPDLPPRYSSISSDLPPRYYSRAHSESEVPTCRTQ
ncbi:hypothetical protein PMAYCL1PPCAC_10004, partial [Pristionchus mayeri]